jgi:adenylate kinase
MNIILIGPPCSGKGTQSKLLAKYYDIKHISTGDLLRAEMAAETDIGKSISERMNSGQYIDDETVMQIAFSNLSYARGNIFDGFPRTVEQAERLTEVLNMEFQRNSKPIVIVLEVKDSNLIKRVQERAKSSGRPEDDVDVFKQRLATFRELTAPVIDYYAKTVKDIIFASGNSDVDTVLNDIVKAIG